MITTFLSIVATAFVIMFGIVWYLFTPPRAEGTEFKVVAINLTSHNAILNRNMYFVVIWKRYLFWHYYFDKKNLEEKTNIFRNDTHLLLFHTKKEAVKYINRKYPLNSIVWKE